MSHADDVRAYCVRQYIQPARAAGRREFSIRAGDVHEAMDYKNRMPLVCSAIGANVFSEENAVRRLAIEGPINGANTMLRFKIV